MKMSSADELEKLTVVQLKEQLKVRGLSSGGVKSVLIQRLLDSSSVDDNILLEEGNGDDIGDADIQALPEEAILGIVTEKTTPPVTSPKIKKPPVTIPVTTSHPPVVAAAAATAVKPPVTSAPAAPPSEKQTIVVKAPSAVSEAERKTARAAKFNLPPTAEDVKKQRAERFGISVSNGGTTGTGSTKLSTSGTEKDTEQLKKRAARFGMPVSETTTTVASDDRKRRRAEKFAAESTAITDEGMKLRLITDEQEAANKRRQRFGQDTITSETDSIKVAKPVDTDAKKKRAERFGVK